MASNTSQVRIPWNSSSLSGDMLMVLFAGGALTLGMINPAFLTVGVLLKAFQKEEYKNKKRFRASFKYLRARGLLAVESKKGQVFLSLTPQGKKHAELYAIAKKLKDLKLFGSRKEGNYLILFDIKSEDKFKRDAFRSLIKRLGSIQIQKSVWLSHYDCREEIVFLRKFFDMTIHECRVVEVKDLGGPPHKGQKE